MARSRLWQIYTTCFALLLPVSLVAATLTVDQILQLHKAGIDDQVISDKIQRDGVAFDPDADTLIRLREAGLSNSVLDAVVRGGDRSKATSNVPSVDKIDELYKSKNYPEAADRIMMKVRANSATDRDRAILVLSLLKLDSLEEAKVQLGSFKQLAPSSSYIQPLTAIVTQAEERRRLRTPIDEAIKQLNAKVLQSTISGSLLAESDKRDMLVDAAVLSADFDQATKLLGSGTSLSYSERNRLKLREESLRHQQLAYKAALAEVDTYTYSPAAVSQCRNEGFREHPEVFADTVGAAIGGPQFALSTYFKAVQKLTVLAPLNEAVLDRVFHATLIASKYAELEEIGDKILAAQRHLRVIGYSSDHFVQLVIDLDARSIALEIDDHPFHSSNGYPASQEPTTPFVTSFAQIKQLSQNADYYWEKVPFFDGMQTMMSPNAKAIKVNPGGTFPQYALMAFMQCSIGDAAQKTITHNLGAFVQHALNLSPSSVSLVPPKEDKRSDNRFANMMAGLGMAMGVNGADAVMQSVRMQEATATDQARYKNDLYSSGRFVFSVADSANVLELESALNLTAQPQP